MGFAGSDDAGVIRLDGGDALVHTVDFFTPIVDDPYDWGRIAAANALSDVYAMGGDPFTALQLIGWPRDGLPMELLHDVIAGGADVMGEAGCVIVGGHSIDDQEPKYGFAVTGRVPESDMLTNAAAQPGQTLVLTKPIGTGVIATAHKAGAAPEESLKAAVESMVTLNRGAAAAARRIGVRAATDVTGFGLLGHLSEVVRASSVSATVEASSLDLLPGVRELATQGFIAGGTKRNLKSVSPILDAGDVDEVDQLIAADAQTSGGLLMAVDGALSAALLQALEDEGVHGQVIGVVEERTFDHGPTGRILLKP